MGFKNIASKHADLHSQDLANEVLADVAKRAQETAQLQANFVVLDKVISPVFEQFVSEAVDLNYAATTNVVNNNSLRSWWTFAFVPAPNEKVMRDPQFSGLNNDAHALARVYWDGRCTLEWHLPGGWICDTKAFTKDQLHRELKMDGITAEVINAWLEEFVKAMLEYRQKKDDSKRSS